MARQVEKVEQLWSKPLGFMVHGVLVLSTYLLICLARCRLAQAKGEKKYLADEPSCGQVNLTSTMGINIPG